MMPSRESTYIPGGSSRFPRTYLVSISHNSTSPTIYRRKLLDVKRLLLNCHIQVKLCGDNVCLKLRRRLILGTSKGIYLGGTLLSILLSLYLYTSGRRETAIFVGLWAPTVLNLGQTLAENDKD
jgi:hypothetical protein